MADLPASPEDMPLRSLSGGSRAALYARLQADLQASEGLRGLKSEPLTPQSDCSSHSGLDKYHPNVYQDVAGEHCLPCRAAGAAQFFCCVASGTLSAVHVDSNGLPSHLRGNAPHRFGQSHSLRAVGTAGWEELLCSKENLPPATPREAHSSEDDMFEYKLHMLASSLKVIPFQAMPPHASVQRLTAL